jgi:hypothetical protein
MSDARGAWRPHNLSNGQNVSSNETIKTMKTMKAMNQAAMNQAAAKANGSQDRLQVCTSCWEKHHHPLLLCTWQRLFRCKRNALRGVLRRWHERVLVS